MSGLRISSRLRKPITTIDQNLEDDEDIFINPKPKISTRSVTSNKRSSTDDYNEQETVTPKKRQKKKSTTTTKTSPYFNNKPAEKKTPKPKVAKKNEPKTKSTINENATLPKATTSQTVKTEFEVNIKFPMLYVWAFDTDPSSSYAKDVTKRYSQKWLTTSYRTSHIEHKTNGDPKWYGKCMKKYQPKDKRKSEYSQVENKQIENQLARQPIPQTKSELNGHPLYVLKSKLLKFEGIYPNETQPIGWFKEEPIYSRDNIHILRSKQTWLKEARQVNPDEEPYKLVEGRIKNLDRKMGVTTRPQLELFGEWQTSEYVPPVAKDGIVPCNEYGNVDLFKPEMIPNGCVHIVEPNAARLCKKLGINCAEAITGFDAHGGGSHPVIEGIVICKEFEQALRDAVEQQKQITLEKEIKKKDERIYKNWRKLIRGLIIKQNLARKYADMDGTQMATDAKYQWPVLPKEDNKNDENSM
ncbi:unnamed protein product [Rotaria magnacalcarata]|uniref:Uncharacterized protein n=1 Tax=Rotaria magnacalcarata TaxID=392030 RepID=A0A818YKV2_9BILA|nr:unnamed protein product [Rotaria magnacalcarata]